MSVSNVPGRPFKGEDAPNRAYRHLRTFHGVDPFIARNRLEKLKDLAGLAADDNVIIGRTGDVYNAVTGERLGTLTALSLGKER